MPSLIVYCLAGAAHIVASADAAKPPAPVLADARVIFAQAEQGVQRQQPQKQKRARGGMSEQQLLQSPMVQHILQDPELQQQIMDDPRFEALMKDPQMQRLMQNPQLQRQMRENQLLRQMYQLQKRPLPGASADEDE